MPRRLQAESGLLLLGMLIAALSIGFAVYAITASSDTPSIPGNEHLLIFTRPAQSTRPPDGALAARPATHPTEVDPIVTGSIARRPLASSERIKGYVLLQIFGDRALLQCDSGLILAGPGAALPGAGTVSGMEQRQGGWVVVTSVGIIGPRLR